VVQEMEYIWYASYGSNLSEERFLCYIKGGTPVGSLKNYTGCSNKDLPEDKSELMINSELYFAQKSKSWMGSGVAFIKNLTSTHVTLGRVYLITTDQFIDVLKQENNYEDEILLDFKEIIRQSEHIFTEWNWYNKMLYLGDKEGFPIFTFTHTTPYQHSRPFGNYLTVMARGLKETFHFNKGDIIDYLISKDGVKENYTREELSIILEV
jgi:hypothetical protein